jgi:hypothetical protein
MQIFAPGWIYMLFSLVAALALAGMVIKHPDHSALITLSRLRHKNQIMVLLSLHVGLFIFVVVARYVLSATIDTGQGRHLFPALPVIALLISGGVYRLAQIITHYLPRWRPAFSFTYFTLITPFLVAAFYFLVAGEDQWRFWLTLCVCCLPHPPGNHHRTCRGDGSSARADHDRLLFL